tara:strand:- start:209 stop:577 length:369 start_codon:yes stop_codon:yes gene_type:complete
MNRLITKIIIVSTMLISSGVLADNKNSLVGMWVTIGHSKTLTSDRSDLTLYSEKGLYRWEIKSNGKIRMYTDIGSDEFPYKIDGNKLTVSQFGMEQSFEIVEVTDSSLVVKNFMDTYHYYER